MTKHKKMTKVKKRKKKRIYATKSTLVINDVDALWHEHTLSELLH
jgi:hypothetical protein